MAAMEEAYCEDLAYVHDAGFGMVADAAGRELVTRLHSCGISQGLVVDLGCGSGILSEHVATAGFRVHGIDLSPAMIHMAQRRVPAGSFHVQSLLTANLPRCVAVAAVGECFNFLFDNTNTPDLVHDVLRRIHNSLEPGGILVFDMAGPGRVPAPGMTRNFFEGQGWAVLVASEEDRGTLTRHITTFRETATGYYRRTVETHRLQLLPSTLVESWLKDIGFQHEVGDSYGTFRLRPGWTSYWAQKPSGASK
jgi:SAM-dependent methyltransferase